MTNFFNKFSTSELWLSWQSCLFQAPEVRGSSPFIQNMCLLLTVEKTKIQKMRPGMDQRELQILLILDGTA